MFLILGFVLVAGCLFGAFIAHGGHIAVLYQPNGL